MNRKPDSVENSSVDQKSIEKMTILQLIGSLNIGQLWKFGGIILGLIIAAFSGGHKLGSTSNQMKIDQLNADIENKSTEIVNYRKKDRFLSLYLRYEKADYSDDSKERDALFSYVERFLDDSEKKESYVGVGKGKEYSMTVTFWDGSQWEMPGELEIELE